MSAAAGQVGLAGLQINGTTDAVTISTGGGIYSVYNCNVTAGTSNAISISQGTSYITECRINSNNGTSSANAAIAIGAGAIVTLRNSTISNQILNPSAVITNNGTFTMRNCIVQSLNTASTTLQALIIFSGSANKVLEISNCNLTYANVLTDTSTNKSCIQFANATGSYTLTMTFCLLQCEGAVTGSGANIQCIQKPGAGSATMLYGNLIAGATANHIAPAITHTAFINVT